MINHKAVGHANVCVWHTQHTVHQLLSDENAKLSLVQQRLGEREAHHREEVEGVVGRADALKVRINFFDLFCRKLFRLCPPSLSLPSPVCQNYFH